MKYVAPSAPLPIGGVLDNWIRLFRGSFAGCWAFALIAGAAGAAVEFVITPTVPTPGVPRVQSYMQFWSGLRGPSVLLADILLIVISLLVYGALLTQQAAIVRGEELFSFSTALTKGVRRIPQMLLGGLVMMAIFMAMLVPAGIAAAVLFPFRRVPAVMALAVLLVIGLVILFIYVSLRLQIWTAVMFSENRSGPASLGRSWELVKGHWWRVMGIAFVSGVVIWVLSLAIGGTIGLVTGIMGIRGTSPDLLVRRMQLISAASEVAKLVTMPLLTAAWFAIYQDLRLRREGGDLAARTEALSAK